MANNQAKSILIFSTAYFPLIGGAEVAVREITDRVGNFEFDMITAWMYRSSAKFERIGNVNVYRVGLGWGFLDKFTMPVFGLIKAISLNKKRNYRFAWSIMASQAGVAAVFFKIFSGKKLLLTLQEGDPEKHLQRYAAKIGFLYKIFIQPWHLITFRKADYLTVISQYLYNRALRNGVDPSKIKIISNGVDIEKFKNGPDPGLKIRLGIKKDEKVILHVGRLVKKNGLEDLIEAGQYLDFPFKIVLVGGGKDEDKLRNLAKKLALRDSVIFVGQIDYDDLSKYYSMADVFVRPSRSEGFGNVFLEALACGAPIIGTATGGSAVRFLFEHKAGLYCNPNEPKHLAKQIKIAFSNNEKMKNYVQRGQELIKQEYTWEAIARKMEKIYQKLIND